MKDDEIQCWLNVKKDIPKFNKYKNISMDGQERPDFLFEFEGELIGIEHFLVDLVETKIKNSKVPQSRTNAKDEKKLIEEWQPHLEEEDFVEKALPDTEQCVNEEIQRYALFDYKKFINEFKRIFNDHIEKSKSYEKTDRLGFLIELPVPVFTWMVQEKNGNWHKQRINSIPITEDILNIINGFDEVDFVIIHVVQNHNKSSNHKSVVYDKSNCPNHIYRSFKFIDLLMNGNTSVKLNVEHR